MEHVGIVVDDLEAATAFFAELGLERQGGGQVDGEWVDRVVGLDGIQVEFAMMETPDGGGRLELVKFHAPASPAGDPQAPANVPGLRHLAFRVDDIDAIIERLRPHGARDGRRGRAVPGHVPALLPPRPGGDDRRAGPADRLTLPGRYLAHVELRGRRADNSVVGVEVSSARRSRSAPPGIDGSVDAGLPAGLGCRGGLATGGGDAAGARRASRLLADDPRCLGRIRRDRACPSARRRRARRPAPRRGMPVRDPVLAVDRGRHSTGVLPAPATCPSYAGTFGGSGRRDRGSRSETAEVRLVGIEPTTLRSGGARSIP